MAQKRKAISTSTDDSDNREIFSLAAASKQVLFHYDPALVHYPCTFEEKSRSVLEPVKLWKPYVVVWRPAALFQHGVVPCIHCLRNGKLPCKPISSGILKRHAEDLGHATKVLYKKYMCSSSKNYFNTMDLEFLKVLDQSAMELFPYFIIQNGKLASKTVMHMVHRSMMRSGGMTEAINDINFHRTNRYNDIVKRYAFICQSMVQPAPFQEFEVWKEANLLKQGSTFLRTLWLRMTSICEDLAKHCLKSELPRRVVRVDWSYKITKKVRNLPDDVNCVILMMNEDNKILDFGWVKSESHESQRAYWRNMRNRCEEAGINSRDLYVIVDNVKQFEKVIKEEFSDHIKQDPFHLIKRPSENHAFDKDYSKLFSKFFSAALYSGFTSEMKFRDLNEPEIQAKLVKEVFEEIPMRVRNQDSSIFENELKKVLEIILGGYVYVKENVFYSKVLGKEITILSTSQVESINNCLKGLIGTPSNFDLVKRIVEIFVCQTNMGDKNFLSTLKTTALCLHLGFPHVPKEWFALLASTKPVFQMKMESDEFKEIEPDYDLSTFLPIVCTSKLPEQDALLQFADQFNSENVGAALKELNKFVFGPESNMFHANILENTDLIIPTRRAPLTFLERSILRHLNEELRNLNEDLHLDIVLLVAYNCFYYYFRMSKLDLELHRLSLSCIQRFLKDSANSRKPEKNFNILKFIHFDAAVTTDDGATASLIETAFVNHIATILKTSTIDKPSKAFKALWTFASHIKNSNIKKRSPLYMQSKWSNVSRKWNRTTKSEAPSESHLETDGKFSELVNETTTSKSKKRATSSRPSNLSSETLSFLSKGNPAETWDEYKQLIRIANIADDE